MKQNRNHQKTLFLMNQFCLKMESSEYKDKLMNLRKMHQNFMLHLLIMNWTKIKLFFQMSIKLLHTWLLFNNQKFLTLHWMMQLLQFIRLLWLVMLSKTLCNFIRVCTSYIQKFGHKNGKEELKLIMNNWLRNSIQHFTICSVPSKKE